MEHSAFIGLLGKSSAQEIRQAFTGLLREHARATFLAVLAEEVKELCGPAYHPTPGGCRRAGSAAGFFFDEDRREEILRPRVRQRQADGRDQEVRLESYQVGQDASGLQDSILEALRAGVSSRDQQGLQKQVRGSSKSQVSRLWASESAKALETYRTRDIRSERWLVLMLDGVALADDLVAIAALGITADGRKELLDFEVGSTENEVVATALLTRIRERGFTPAAGSLLVVLDGAKALRKAVIKVYPTSLIQRCLVHKERNLRGYLSRRDYGSLAGLFNRLRRAQGLAAAQEVLADLRRFLSTRNKQAQESLEEGQEDLLTLFHLEVPSTLNVSLLSTNAIENAYKNTRRKLARVDRWRVETDQAARWLAYAFTEAEKGFRRIRGYQDLPALQAALQRHSEGQEKELDVTRQVG